MTELLPGVQASAIQDGILDYLGTTFALADDDARNALLDFLSDPENGIFKGPYLRVRLPFRAAADGWRDTLDTYKEKFPPYGHQAEAFARLTSIDLGESKRRPRPTLVTTGTGSGKTESFLIPIIDHVLRAKRQGIKGTKALILYPMNALANDQAQRLAAMLTKHDEFAAVTAALYIGELGPKRSKVSKDGLITNRDVIRSDPPDILLTNYKMLDQMLLRAADARIWEESARSLQYLVLDEFHTYDGAQGTDVSMLLRRFGLALKSYWPEDAFTQADRDRPLGIVTPVATSATLGAKGDAGAMLDFARTVFGEEFDDDAVVTESRLDVDEWAGAPASSAEPRTDREAVELAVKAGAGLVNGRAIAEAVLGNLFDLDKPLAGVTAEDLLVLAKAHPFVRQLAQQAEQARPLPELIDEILPAFAADEASLQEGEQFLLLLSAALSHVRTEVGRGALSVDLHLWVRELTRIDRVALGSPHYLWSDDRLINGESPDGEGSSAPSFPAIYCRHCGRSGWSVLRAPVGGFDLAASDAGDIRHARWTNNDAFRALIHAPAEAAAQTEDNAPVVADPDEPRLMWFHTTERRLLPQRPGDDDADVAAGRVLPVLAHAGPDAGTFSTNDTCPSCIQRDGIRFLGSSIATLLSVSLSTIFGSDDLDKEEKKALVFTDSVQDAAHRAGFVQSRSHSLTLRAVIRGATGDDPVSLDVLADRVLQDAGDDPHRRYRILPPDFADRKEFEQFWQGEKASQIPVAVRRRVKRRLLLDTVLEFGLQSRLGRTLELTGSLAAEVDVPRGTMLKAASEVEKKVGQEHLEGLGLTDEQRISWVRGVLERMRTDGAIEHEWFRRYQDEDGRRYSIWGGRPRSEGMPAFPAGRGAPAYPRVGGATGQRHSDLVTVGSSQSWYATWTARAMHCTPKEGASLAVALLNELADRDVIRSVNTDSGGRVYELLQSRVLVSPVDDDGLASGSYLLACDLCRSAVPGSRRVVNELEGAPCLVARCSGHLSRSSGQPGNFYRRLYQASDVTRVVAREHTSLLEDAVRLKYENQFKASARDPQAPNVIVATPTLEMGIDIGDLSTVMLASLPKSVASYLQRVGRAGRLTGSALNLAFVSGRGEQLPRLGDPLSVVNGEVRPPATYIDADEILRRQYVASLADRLARTAGAPHPATATQAIGTVEDGSFLLALIEAAESPESSEHFLATFDGLSHQSRDRLTEWTTPSAGPRSSALSTYLHECRHRWAAHTEGLRHRIQGIQERLPELQERANLPAATDDDKLAVRTAASALGLARKQLADLQGEYWISVLEEHGILPNYTLFDDSVTLDVTLSWIDPDTQEFQSEPATFNRGASTALREFAPGATFYARGHKIEIDAVDLGTEGEAIRPWVFCPTCGYAEERDAPPQSCPRCGDQGIADAGQLLDVVELERVSSAMRREEAAIDDGRDERERTSFHIALAADVDEPRQQWFIDGYLFGVKYLTDLTIRWLNLGKTTDPGPGLHVAGAEYPAPLFRVCVGCGKLDSQTGRNSAAEHRPWCAYRNAADEDVRKVVLARTLRTEGIIVQVPPDLPVGDPFAVPSLVAAMQAGLREHLGGAPDHLAFERIHSDGAAAREAILVHDTVPGGTGYLAELADPARFRAVLFRSWTLVRDCPCRHEGRASCHRCLSPFINSSAAQKYVSRNAAERHLKAILLGTELDGEPASQGLGSWAVSEQEASAYDPETGIEKKFREVLRERLETAGLTPQVQDGPDGVRWTINAAQGRTWVLEPQLGLGGVKPDFVLRSNDLAVPGLAVFCDGWRYHASPTINRIADDAKKRELLREQGYAVVGVVWSDLVAAQEGNVSPPPWYSERRWTQVMQSAGGGLNPGLRDLVVGGPIDYIVRWISQPDPAAFRALAEALPLLLAGSGPVGKSQGALMGATTALHGDKAIGTHGDRPAWGWVHDTLTVFARALGSQSAASEVAALLDDRDDRLGEAHKPAWQEWLRISNLLNLRQQPARIVAYSQALGAEASTTEEGVELAGEWGDLYRDAVEPEERDLLAGLASADVPVPVLGHEVDGLPLAISWPAQRIVVELGLEAEDQADLATEGWTIVTPNLTEIRNQLTAAGG